MWRKEIARGKRLEVDYSSDVSLPAARQMLPVANVSNPVQVFLGNSALRPEYKHQLRLHWLRFDEFNLSSLFANMSFRYTADKINWSRSIGADLAQKLTLVNVRDDYRASGRVEYSSPVRKLGMMVTGSLSEEFQQGISLVNDVANRTTVYEHSAELRLGNRKKDKWDIQAGISAKYTDALYSNQSELNNYFYNIAYFGEISYSPHDRLHLLCTADINSYFSKSFTGVINIPLLKAEASWFFLKNNRGSFTLNAFDLLNANTGLQRISELNYLVEKRSNIIGQYFMLSFKYRLNSSGEKKRENVITIGR
jgi:hypothetical protein